MTQQAEKKEKKSYKDTLNLPKTGFGQKANLVQNEPASQKRWQEMGLYRKIREARTGSPRYVFHDGPPYANGSIHLGHLLNKVLKDVVVRSKTMAGYDCPYTPGWDCHGLPIEHKVMQDLGEKSRTLNALQIRGRCKDSAEKFIKLQKGQMQRLLTVADYDEPYKTMDPLYEATVLEQFGELVGHGLVKRDLKPVHWSVENRTALAEAELEYYDREDTSVFVLFEVGAAPRGIPFTDTYLMIWTTTPWTLPANMAVAVHLKYEYGIYSISFRGKKIRVIVATALASRVFELGKISDAVLEKTVFGHELISVGYRHPFVNRTGRVVEADYVTLEDGTGLVHTAPGHGTEDYQTGLREKIDIYCPVREDGTFDDTVPDWLRGLSIWKANPLVVEHLRGSGHLFYDHKFMHSYPHDWRGKTPVIFRATEQWFIKVNEPFALPGDVNNFRGSLRERALGATEQGVKFIPEWGRNRMRGMLESRPDWCISRQRAWGLPIPAFFNEKGEALLTRASVRAVAQVVRTQGSDAWFKLTPAELLQGYDPAQDPDGPAWARQGLATLTKGGDIFDVWFESGTSWAAALRRMQGDYPADLYLEGSDQHRGWFQLSLLPALGCTGKSPFKSVLTHGFMVDKDGKKMSKSLGNTIEVEDLMKQYGADVCRWWVCSLNFENDIKTDMSFFELAGKQYFNVRNTLRYLLSNLSDFDPRKHGHTFTTTDQTSIDAWVLNEVGQLVEKALQSYETFALNRLHELIVNFCTNTLSAEYLSATKDRLYCDRADSPRRRRTQTAYFRIADALIRLLAPVMPHTADEAWNALRTACNLQDVGAPSVHLELFARPQTVPIDPDWAKLAALRDKTFQAIEAVRAAESAKGQENALAPMDLGLILTIDDAHAFIEKFDRRDLADMYGVSQVSLKRVAGSGGYAVEVADLRQTHARCDRSWKRDGTVKPRSDGGQLSDRDAEALGL